MSATLSSPVNVVSTELSMRCESITSSPRTPSRNNPRSKKNQSPWKNKKVEEAYQQAIIEFPPGDKKGYQCVNGHTYNRCEQIQKYIWKETGMCVTRQQVASHNQYNGKKKKIKKGYKHGSLKSIGNTQSFSTTSEERAKIFSMKISVDMEQADELGTSLVHTFAGTKLDWHKMEDVDFRHFENMFPRSNNPIPGSVLLHLCDQGPLYLFKLWVDFDASIIPSACQNIMVNAQYESKNKMNLTCTTTLCNCGVPICEPSIKVPLVRRLAKYSCILEIVQSIPRKRVADRYMYRLNRSPICPIVRQLILTLCDLRNPEMIDGHKDFANFTILQVFNDELSGQTVFSVTFVFEASKNCWGPQSCGYTMTKPVSNEW